MGPYARRILLLALVSGLALAGCEEDAATSRNARPDSPAIGVVDRSTTSTDLLLEESWQVYKDRFIQGDGRVIDRERQDRTVSEGQAYAMLRAVMIDDPDTFARTLEWAEANLRRTDAEGNLTDTLWAWQWGQAPDGSWRILDTNFASDADLDAVTALILAARRWNRPDYLELARTKLEDLWDLSTVSVPAAATRSGRDRYFMPGPAEAFLTQPNLVYLNPSYYAPYAFRLFAQIDPTRDWEGLVDTSYASLVQSADLSETGLPSDWVALDQRNGEYYPIGPSQPLRSVYSFDAYRVWWRVALDAALFDEPRAYDFLETYLAPIEEIWRSQQSVPATIGLDGQPLVDYDSTAQYGMLYAAFYLTDPDLAAQILDQKLLPRYQNGIWDNDTAYYTQNLSWFGLFSASDVASTWLRP
ncbi:MAG: glycosyl hydrolase family 8 [Elainellaceae cyanobacterium]